MPPLSKIYYAWTGWLKTDWQPEDPTPPEALFRAWTTDGIEPLSLLCRDKTVRLILEASPAAHAQFITGRIKGRLHHAWKQVHSDFPGFDRPFHFRSLGQNDREVVKNYVRQQVQNSDLVDPLYRERLQELVFSKDDDGNVKSSHNGIYDLLAHVIVITADRYRMFSDIAGEARTSLNLACAQAKLELLEISVMPDHVHMLVRYPSDLAPEPMVERLKKDSGAVIQRSAFWREGGYFGTVGPYRLAIALERNRQAGGWERGNRCKA